LRGGEARDRSILIEGVGSSFDDSKRLPEVSDLSDATWHEQVRRRVGL
jgi:hypothetical protein